MSIILKKTVSSSKGIRQYSFKLEENVENIIVTSSTCVLSSTIHHLRT